MSGIDQTEDQWHVQIEAGDVRLWTLDQLDAAFKAELVDESTFVLEVGKTEWMQLGTLLGGGDDEEEPASATATPAPVAVNAPLAPVMFSEPPPSLGPYSTAPMAADIEDFDSPASFRGSRKRPVAIGLGVVAIAAGVAFFAARHGAFAEAPADTAVAAVAPPAAPPPAPAADPAPPTQPAQDPSSLSARLTQDQLDKLAIADKAQQAKLAAQQKARAAAVTHHSSSHHLKEKSPFHTGGDKYDPLNAKL